MLTFWFLLLEDKPLAPEAMQTILTDSFGIEALRAIEQSVPSLSISAIGLPEMDGYMPQQVRTLEQVRQIPVIALTAYAGEIDRQQVIAAGFGQHIPKPVAPEKLVSAICDLCRTSFNSQTQ